MKKRIKMMKVKTRSSKNDSLEQELSRMKRMCSGWLVQASSLKRDWSREGLIFTNPRHKNEFKKEILSFF